MNFYHTALGGFGLVLAAGLPLAGSGNGQPGTAAATRSAPAAAAAAPPGLRLGKKGKLTIQGREIKRGADLRGVNLAGADLRWRDLRDTDLRRANLTGARLCGAKLANAKLAGTILTGADLEEANLFNANIFGSVGGDTSKAHLHPFFSEEAPEKEGSVRLFIGLQQRGSVGGIRSLTVGPTGNIYWLTGAAGLVMLDKTGALFDSQPMEAIPETRRFSMALDNQDQLLIFGERQLTFFDLQACEGSKVLPPGVDPFRLTRSRVPHADEVPLATLATPWGSVLLVRPSANVDFQRTPNGATVVHVLGGLPGFSGSPLLFHPGDRCAYFVDAQQGALRGYLLDEVPEPQLRFSCPLGLFTREQPPNLLAAGPDGRIWAARRGEGRICAYTVTPGHPPDPVEYPLPAGASLFHLAAGPDGNLWATDPKANQILRITPAGGVKAYPLPAGTLPAEIRNYQHGKLLFTTLGGERFGSIRAVASPGKVWPELDFPDPKAADARPASAAGSDPDPLQTLAEARLEELWAEDPQESLAPGRNAGAPAPPAPTPPPKEAATSSSQRSPRTQLQQHEILLTGKATQHILDRHRDGLDNGASRFAPAFSDAVGLERLLAASLVESMQSGLFGRVRMWDHREQSYTICTAEEPVGTYQRHQEATPTRSFVVVTVAQRDRGSGRRVHAVVTAYPIGPGW